LDERLGLVGLSRILVIWPAVFWGVPRVPWC